MPPLDFKMSIVSMNFLCICILPSFEVHCALIILLLCYVFLLILLLFILIQYFLALYYLLLDSFLLFSLHSSFFPLIPSLLLLRSFSNFHFSKNGQDAIRNISLHCNDKNIKFKT